MIATALVDIDGVLADASHRLPLIKQEPKNWDEFFGRVGEDPPILSAIQLVQHLSLGGLNIVLLTGRRKSCFIDTTEWLKKHEVPYDTLIMRPTGLHCPADEFKMAAYKELEKQGHHVVVLIEDNPKTAETFRAAGVFVLLAPTWHHDEASRQEIPGDLHTHS